MMNGYYLFKTLPDWIFSIEWYGWVLSAICKRKLMFLLFLLVSLFIYLSIEKVESYILSMGTYCKLSPFTKGDNEITYGCQRSYLPFLLKLMTVCIVTSVKW